MMHESEHNPDITQLLEQASGGDELALDELIQIAYGDLKQIAAGIRRKHFDPSQTINTTALVNEAWLKIRKHGLNAENRKHFYCITALAMQQVLVNEANRKNAQKRQAPEQPEPGVHEDQATWMIILNQILTRLDEQKPRLAEVFRLRYFLGMTEDETAELLAVNSRTVRRDWLTAKQLISEVIA